MKIAHLSDTHLGYAGPGYPQWVPHPWRSGILIHQWEADIMSGLARAVDAILDRVRPDIVIHTGDLFDSPRPTPHSIDFAMTQLKRLSAAGIPVVLVEGVHSYPRDHTRGHIVNLLAHVDSVTVFSERAGQVRIGAATIHTLPYLATARGQGPSQESLHEGTYNVLMAHAVADGHRYFRSQNRPAPDLAVSACAGWYDYIALGHYHFFAQVADTECAFYSGATAMVSWSDLRPGYSFSFNVVEIGGSSPKVTRELLETRPMHAYGLDNAQGLSAAQVLDLLSRQVEASPPGSAYCLVEVHGMDPHARRELDIDSLRALFREAAALRLHVPPRPQNWGAALQRARTEMDPQERFARIVGAFALPRELEHEVVARGRQILQQAAKEVLAEDTDEKHTREEAE